MAATLTTVTVFAERTSRVRAFYSEVLGLPIAFQQGDHIACMPAGAGGTYLCIHDDTEAPDGATELIFIDDDHPALIGRARAGGFEVREHTTAAGSRVLQLKDPNGNLVRVQPMPSDLDDWLRGVLHQTLALGYTPERIIELLDLAADSAPV